MIEIICIIIPELIATSFATPTAMKLIAPPPSRVPNPPIPWTGIIEVIKDNIDAPRKGQVYLRRVLLLSLLFPFAWDIN